MVNISVSHKVLQYCHSLSKAIHLLFHRIFDIAKVHFAGWIDWLYGNMYSSMHPRLILPRIHALEP